MSFTPVTWLADQVSRIRVGGSEIRSRFPTEKIPTPLLKVGFLVLVVLFFVDEFLILAAIFGGPVALAMLLGFAATVWIARRTKRGRALRDKTARGARKALKGKTGRRYRRRKER